MYNLFYLVNPKYGGWATFTAHLCYNINQRFIMKVGQSLEKKTRDFGWGVDYQNVPEDYFKQAKDPIIIALEKSHYNLLPTIINRGKDAILISHDNVEFKKEALDAIRTGGLKIIAIREAIKRYLNDNDIPAEYVVHPFYPYKIPERPPNAPVTSLNTSVSLSRVDFDKHTEILIEANQILQQKPFQDIKIEIYGPINRIYEFHTLNKMIQPQKWQPFGSKYPFYKGVFAKKFEIPSHILRGKAFLIDMTAINKDGGGTQYTFLEAIYNQVPIVLNRKWTTGNNKEDEFKEGYNCFMVSNAEELVELLIKRRRGNLETHKIVENANKLLERHLNVKWEEKLNKKTTAD